MYKTCTNEGQPKQLPNWNCWISNLIFTVQWSTSWLKRKLILTGSRFFLGINYCPILTILRFFLKVFVFRPKNMLIIVWESSRNSPKCRRLKKSISSTDCISYSWWYCFHHIQLSNSQHWHKLNRFLTVCCRMRSLVNMVNNSIGIVFCNDCKTKW